MSSTTVAISGCGAAVELYHAPALERLESARALRVIGLFDPSVERRAAIGRRFPEARTVAEYGELLALRPDLVLVASPPGRHHEQVMAALSRGTHVLCEKPLATNGADAREMAATARSQDRILAVGMIRRYLPAARMVRRSVADGHLGTVERFDVFEGGPFRWPLHSPDYFERTGSGGGVVADIGSHLLDLLVWWLGPIDGVVAADDALGGVEANALLEVRCGGVSGRVRISRDWFRPNRVMMSGSEGWLEWNLEQTDRIELRRFRGGGRGTSEIGGPPVTFESCFDLQLRDVLDAIAGRPSAVVGGEEAARIVEAVEHVYQVSELLEMPWFSPLERSAATRLRTERALP